MSPAAEESSPALASSPPSSWPLAEWDCGFLMMILRVLDLPPPAAACMLLGTGVGRAEGFGLVDGAHVLGERVGAGEGAVAFCGQRGWG